MRVEEQIRFWKDADYRESMSDVHQLSANPAGAVEVEDSALESIVGAKTEMLLSAGCNCGGFTGACEGFSWVYFCTSGCTPTIVGTRGCDET